MKFVLDASFFINLDSIPEIEGELYITNKVIMEIKDIKSRTFLEALIRNKRARIVDIEEKEVKKTRVLLEKKFLLKNLSETDIELLALAKKENATLMTDDFSLQNAAKALKIPFKGITREIKEGFYFVYICPACGKKYPKEGVCLECGVELRRKKIRVS